MSRIDELYETGTEPEFFIQRIAKVEVAEEAVFRVYIASRRRDCLRLEFTALMTPSAAAEIGRALLRFADKPREAADLQSLEAPLLPN
jgi:hypothetical protein